MRRYTLLYIVALIGMALPATASTIRTQLLEFGRNDFIYSKDEAGRMTITSSGHHCFYDCDYSAPALPYIIAEVVIDDNQCFKSFSWSKTGSVEMSQVTMASNPYVTIEPDDMPPADWNNGRFPKLSYPESSVTYLGTMVQDGRKTLSFKVYPFSYDTGSRSLSLCTSCQLDIELSTESLPAVKQLAAQSTSSTSQTVDYVIITSQALSSAFQPLADWKTKKGVRTEIVTTEAIDNNYSGSTRQLRLKRCLEDYYQNHGLQFALLGGDVEIVPTQYCYNRVIKVYTNPNTNISDTVALRAGNVPTDLFYSNFQAPFDWNANGNDVVGELADNVNFTPQIYVTRAPVSNVQDASVFVNKILSYERNPPVESWNDSILMVGNRLDSYLGIKGRGDFVYDYYIAPYWDGTRITYYDEDQPDNQITGSGIQERLQDGYPFVEVMSHGIYNAWQLKSSLNYTTSHASSLVSPQPTIISTIACLTNAFDTENETCLSESFIRNPNSGVVAYLGCSREGVYAVFNYLGPSEMLEDSFFERMFSGKAFIWDAPNNFGRIVGDVKKSYSAVSTHAENIRWVECGVNPIGDPEMPVFTKRPLLMDSVVCTIVNGVLSVSTGLDKCRICVMGLDDGNDCYEVLNDVSSASLPVSGSQYSVCVTKPGYVPFTMEMDNENVVYIQNETMATDRHVTASKVFIGSDVTSEKAYGPVTIEGGKTTVLGDSVVIKNNFEVKTGAELYIGNR